MEYEAVVKGALKLKGTANKEIQKKSKKKNKEKAQHDVDSKPTEATSSTKVETSHPQHHKQAIFKTKAQLKFEQMKEEQLKKRILDKASKTHKQRVEEFNRHLDSLTEHFDIPKVSWTK
uniref:EOG090X0P1V n=1 Tax=Alona affinis TaxID=381656 RepID=A0A9N6WPL2_9CRUS|nr:EOG090X0P1V [Alona affinis]